MITDLFIHPTSWFILGALLMPFAKRFGFHKIWLIVIPLVAMATIYRLPDSFGIVNYLGFELQFGRVDKLTFIFLHVFTLMALIGCIFGLHVKETGQHIAAFLYVAGSLGVTLAGDYLTLFIFWELMAFASTFLIWYRKKQRSIEAGYRYLLVHTAGGLVLLAGIFLLYQTGHDLSFGIFSQEGAGWAEYLIMIGFLLNAAAPPIHAWLPDAYPEATVTGAVFMCAFTTKTAVYVLMRGFPGFEVLAIIGACMALYGVGYAVIENDARRILAYHVVSQVGYMVCGVGIGTAMALNGVAAHAYAHIIYKALLFMGAGAVLEMTGRSKLSELGGLYRTMPLTMIFTIIGGISISGFPLTSGFVSKSMIVAAAGYNHQTVLLVMLLLAGVGTFLSVGIKLPYFIWFGKDSGIRAKEAPWNMQLAMAMAAFVCILFGVYPAALYSMLPYAAEYHPYYAYHLSETFQLMAFTGLGFYLMVKYLKPHDVSNLDLDWFYRKGSVRFVNFARGPIVSVNDWVSNVYKNIGLRLTMALARAFSWFDKEGIDWTIDGSARNIVAGGNSVRQIQTGRIQHYIAAGVIAVLVVLVVVILT
ncbi:MAG: Na(+)/H(+) antiporter subunit D [Pelovirga sp.]